MNNGRGKCMCCYQLLHMLWREREREGKERENETEIEHDKPRVRGYCFMSVVVCFINQICLLVAKCS